MKCVGVNGFKLSMGIVCLEGGPCNHLNSDNSGCRLSLSVYICMRVFVWAMLHSYRYAYVEIVFISLYGNDTERDSYPC